MGREGTQAIDGEKLKSLSIPSGISSFDRRYGGFRPGELILIGSTPNCGKTSFAISVALNVARQNAGSVFFFTGAETKEQIAWRFFSCISSIPLHEAGYKNIGSPTDFAGTVASTLDEITRYNIRIVDNWSDYKNNPRDVLAPYRTRGGGVRLAIFDPWPLAEVNFKQWRIYHEDYSDAAAEGITDVASEDEDFDDEDIYHQYIDDEDGDDEDDSANEHRRVLKPSPRQYEFRWSEDEEEDAKDESLQRLEQAPASIDMLPEHYKRFPRGIYGNEFTRFANNGAHYFRRLAREFSCVVMLVSGMSRRETVGGVPQEANLLVSDVDLGVADVVLLLDEFRDHSNEYDCEALKLARRMRAFVTKHRHGPSSCLMLNWQPAFSRVRDMEES